MLAGLLLSIALTLPGGLHATSPDLPVFGSGKFVDVFESDDALTNASAHVAWSVALPLAGYAIGGRKGMWAAGLTWIAWSLTNEAFFHAPSNPGPGYPAEVRADLLTRIIPCAAILAWDYFRAGDAPTPVPEATRPRFLLIIPGIDMPSAMSPRAAAPLGTTQPGAASSSPAAADLRERSHEDRSRAVHEGAERGEARADMPREQDDATALQAASDELPLRASDRQTAAADR